MSKFKKICPNCRYAIDDEYTTCPVCNANVKGIKTILCPACNLEISRSAGKCPRCGEPIKPKQNPVVIVAAVIVMIIALMSFFGVRLSPTIQVDGVVEIEPAE